MTTTIKFFDLFSGIGGFRYGLEKCNNYYKYAGSCEINEYARRVYAKNFGKLPEYSDVRDINPTKLEKFNILTAGFPCQAFSYAGKRLGFSDERGTLFFEIIRIAQEVRPEILLLENVKGLLNHDRGRTFTTIIDQISELGYDVEWQVINGKYFVPQNRERIFIIGYLRNSGFKKIFPIINSDQIYDGTYKETSRKREWFRSAFSRTIDSNYWKGGGSRTMILAAYTNSNTRNRIQERDETWVIDTSSGNKQLLVDFDGIRKLTPLECERVMGFPDNWTLLDGISDTQRYRLLGNSVIPQIIQMIGERIIYFKNK